VQVHRTAAGLRRALAGERTRGRSIALAATMGNLHAGHIRLLRSAQRQADITVASIFVNPSQFGAGEDFRRYPRTPRQDRALLQEADVQHLFAPGRSAMYPRDALPHTEVRVPAALSDILCGASRPGHFTGVATVVAKLLQLVQPDVAIFGKKDYQQLCVIRRMVRDLKMPVRIAAVPTVREPDGLAMSSRNRYLGTAERAAAPALYQTLCHTRDRLLAGERNFAALQREGAKRLRAAGFVVDYYNIRDTVNLQSVTFRSKNMIVLAAGVLGNARLIDNISLKTGAVGG